MILTSSPLHYIHQLVISCVVCARALDHQTASGISYKHSLATNGDHMVVLNSAKRGSTKSTTIHNDTDILASSACTECLINVIE
jgi:hypothetical protein